MLPETKLKEFRPELIAFSVVIIILLSLPLLFMA